MLNKKKGFLCPQQPNRRQEFTLGSFPSRNGNFQNECDMLVGLACDGALEREFPGETYPYLLVLVLAAHS